MSLLLCDLDGTRTHDPILKRDMLYLLSYEVDLIYRSFESIAEGERLELSRR